MFPAVEARDLEGPKKDPFLPLSLRTQNLIMKPILHESVTRMAAAGDSSSGVSSFIGHAALLIMDRAIAIQSSIEARTCP